MRILVVSSRPPFPPRRADAMTVDRLLRFLAGRGHTVDLVCFTTSREEERELRAGLGGVCHEIHAVDLPVWRSYGNTARTLLGSLPMQVQYFGSPAMHALIRSRVAAEGYDVVYTHLIRMAEYTRRLALPRVMGVQISQALNLSRMVEHARDPFRKLFYRIECAKVRGYEARACADFDRVFLCGPADVDAIERTAPLPNAVICPHGQDIPPLDRVRASEPTPGAIVLSGVMSTYTNVDAATWFAEEIFPRVEREVPGASFWIVGREPTRRVRALADPPRIVVTGEVDDGSEWLCRAQVAVAPLRIAAGMQNKIVQGLACERAVVATPVANEGIGAEPGRHLLVRERPEELAAAVASLLQSDAEREEIGRAGRRFVEANWTWEANFEKLEKVMREVASA